MSEKQKKTDIKKEFETLKKEYDDIKDSLQRLQAEFINFRKRNEEERQKFMGLANKQLIQKILPVMDNFETALKNNSENTEFYKGVELIYAQFKEILSEEGLEPIDASGEFNPQLHEAILVVEGEQNKIVEELQKGYRLNDQIIRHSKVKISKKGDKK